MADTEAVDPLATSEDLFGDEEELPPEEEAFAAEKRQELSEGTFGSEIQVKAEPGETGDGGAAEEPEDVDALFEPAAEEEDTAMLPADIEAEAERPKREVPVAKGAPVAAVTPRPGKFPASAKILLARLPNVIGIEPREFDPSTYVEDSGQAGAGAADARLPGAPRRQVRLTAEHVVRWRLATDESGNKVAQSNARLVQWPDGSMTLHLGKDTLLATEVPRKDNLSVVYASLPVSAASGAEAEGDSAAVPAQFHQARGLFSSTIQFKPSSIDSEVHTKLKNKIAEQRLKQPKIKRTNLLVDAEAQEKMAKDVEAAERKRKRRREQAASRRSAGERFDGGFLEEDEEEEGAGAAPRPRVKDEEEEAAAEKRLLRAKKGARSQDDALPSDEEPLEESDDDSDTSRRKRKKSKR